MTCIVGLVDQDGAVWMGGDSCGSNGYTYNTTQGHKIFARGESVIGCTGSFRLIDLLRYRLDVRAPREADEPDRYIRCDFLEAVKSTFNSHGYLASEDGVWSFCGPFLVGWRGRLWQVQNNFSVISPPPWGDAVGSGCVAASGSLYTTREMFSDRPDLRVRMALEAAEAVVTTVRGPHRIYKLSTSGVEEVGV